MDEFTSIAVIVLLVGGLSILFGSGRQRLWTAVWMVVTVLRCTSSTLLIYFVAVWISIELLLLLPIAGGENESSH